MATVGPDNIFVNSSGGFLSVLGGGAGEDTYVFLPGPLGLSSGEEVFISDTGSNNLRFVDGLVIESATIASDTLQLVIRTADDPANPATVTIPEVASQNFSFQIGGEIVEPAEQVLTFEEFVTQTLGASVPTGTDLVTVDSPTVIGEMTETVTVTSDIAALTLGATTTQLTLQVEGNAQIGEIVGPTLQRLVVTGDSDLVIQEPLASGVDLVDARGMLGNLRVAYPNENGFTHLGGIGDDFVVVAGNGLDDSDMVDGGAGSNDVLSLFQSIDGGAGVNNIEVVAFADGNVTLDLVNDLPNNVPDFDTNGDGSFDADDLFILFEAGSHDETGETSRIEGFNADNNLQQMNVTNLDVDDFDDFDVTQNGADLELTSTEDFEGTIVLADTLAADIGGNDFFFG